MKAEGMREIGLLVTKLAGPVSPPCFAIGHRNSGNSNCRPIRRTEALWYAVSALLVMAAILKADGISLAIGLRGHRVAADWLILAAIQWEMFLASWLLSRVFCEGAYCATVTTFSIFAFYSLLQVVRGDSSCGCFGRVEVDPRWTAILDFGVLGMLLRWLPPNGLRRRFAIGGPRFVRPFHIPRAMRPALIAWLATFGAGLVTSPKRRTAGLLVPRRSPGNGRETFGHGAVRGQRPSHNQILALIAWLAAMVWSVWVFAFPARGIEDVPGIIRFGPDAVLWEPEKWIGTRLPILDELDVHGDLTQGTWQIVLVRRSCPHCEEFVAEMLMEKSSGEDQRASADLAVVDLDKRLPKELWRCLKQTTSVVGTVRTASHVVLQVPTVIMTQRGIVVQVR